MTDNEYRRKSGMDLATAAREEQSRHPAKVARKVEKPDQRKAADEQCGVDGELLKGIVLGVDPAKSQAQATINVFRGNSVLYFTSIDEYLAWCDTEDGSLD
jgi:hypothetical protein